MKWQGLTDRLVFHKHEDGSVTPFMLCFLKPHKEVVDRLTPMIDYKPCHIELAQAEVPSQVWNALPVKIPFVWTIDGARERWEWNKS